VGLTTVAAMHPILVMFALLLFMNTSWVVALLLVLAVIVCFLVHLIVRQETVLYVPCVVPGMQTPDQNPEGMRSPADKGLEFEDVNLQTSDGLQIHAWFIPAGDKAKAKTAPTILFCHANAGNIGMRVPNFAAIVSKLEANILALDYRGYGRSEGSPTEEGLIEDALTAWRWLRKASDEGRIDGRRVFVFGRSLGGAVAIALTCALQRQSEGAPCGLILENTFASISALVDVMFPILAFKSLKDKFLRLKWESLERIREVEAPLLFLVGEKDEMIPTAHSQALHSGAAKSSLRKKEVFPEGTHNDTWEKGGERYWEVQAGYIKECLDLLKSKPCNSNTLTTTTAD